MLVAIGFALGLSPVPIVAAIVLIAGQAFLRSSVPAAEAVAIEGVY